MGFTLGDFHHDSKYEPFWCYKIPTFFYEKDTFEWQNEQKYLWEEFGGNFQFWKSVPNELLSLWGHCAWSFITISQLIRLTHSRNFSQNFRKHTGVLWISVLSWRECGSYREIHICCYMDTPPRNGEINTPWRPKAPCAHLKNNTPSNFLTLRPP